MPSSITGANAVIMISIPLLFPVPQQLQGFAADDIFTTDTLQSAETLMGVDGKLSGGFVHVPVPQNYSLQGDSLSNFMFDQWWTAQQQAQELFTANGIVLLTAVGSKWTLTKGFLSGYKPMPDVKKLVQPRPYQITWESVLPAVA